jgi:hypothetical protein
MAKKTPTATVRLENGRLSPLTIWDAELLSDMPNGTEFEIFRLSPRSVRHNGMYRAQLDLIVKATEAFPSPDKMHDWIKHSLGYTAPIMDPKGNIIAVVLDSAAFDKMDQAAFNVFYQQAERLIAEEMGIDLADVKPGFSI